MPLAQQAKVVVVEDDQGLGQAIERILRLAGFVPLSFDSAETMLAAGDLNGVSCMVCDVHLPGITGFELRDQLCRQAPQPPVIFISAYDEPESRLQAQHAGAAAFLQKPFSGHELLAAIKRATGG